MSHDRAIDTRLLDADDARAECDCRRWAEAAAVTIARLTRERDEWRTKAHDLALIVWAPRSQARIPHSWVRPENRDETRCKAPGGAERGGSVSGEGPGDSGRSQTYKPGPLPVMGSVAWAEFGA